MTIPINFGILIYNNTFSKFSSSNIGDYIQSLAAINIYRKIVQKINNTNYTIENFLKDIIKNQIKGFNFVFIKRDNLHEIDQYKNLNNIITIMNGWWLHPYNKNNDVSFKVPNNITPIFVSFHIANDKLFENTYINELKRFEPIGCRDLVTTEKLQNKGVKAYFSGCLTTTIDFYYWEKKTNNVYCVDTKKNNDSHIYVTQLNNKWKNINHVKGFYDALDLLKKYKVSHKVYTSRLHCFLPCLAIGVPVNLISPSGNKNIKSWGSKNRFDGLRELENDRSKFLNIKNTLTNNVISIIEKII